MNSVHISPAVHPHQTQSQTNKNLHKKTFNVIRVILRNFGYTPPAIIFRSDSLN